MYQRRGFLLCVVVLTAGCPREASPPVPSAEPRPSVTLRVVVVNEPELAESIERLRGEWADRFGGELNTAAMPWEELAAQPAIDADVVVFPSRYLGELCVRKWLRPVRSNVMESHELDASDFFPLVRQELIEWGGEVMALPLGVQPVGFGGKPSPPASVELLARAAGDAISKDRIGLLFDSETMRPRINEPAFVEALTTIVQTGTDGGDDRKPRASLPVVGYSDRLIGVTGASRNAASAFKLAEWLAQRDISSQLARAGDGTLPVRRSLASSPLWYDQGVTPAERDRLGDALVALLDRYQSFVVPRIPGVDEYLAALDESIRGATQGGEAPQKALEEAARRWEEITDARGRDSQRQAYLKHLGFAEP